LSPYVEPLQLVTGLLVFVRVLGVFATAPVFAHAHVPSPIKACMAAMISLVLLPAASAPPPGLCTDVLTLASAVAREALVGLIMGFAVTLLFLAVQLAGELIDVQMGFGMAAVMDPLLNTQASLIAQFQYLVATLMFLATNGHHALIVALSDSLRLVPLASAHPGPAVAGSALDAVAHLFLLGVHLGAPVLLALVLTDLALGLLGRTLPQMNLLLVGMPAKILVGLAMLLLSLPSFVPACHDLFGGVHHYVLRFLIAGAGTPLA
jgi:flagellar biosynthesis protein FliR